MLDGHALILQLCHAKKDEQAEKKVGKDKSSTKLLVRNVAFEATEKDLRQLFSPFGQVITYINLILVHFVKCIYNSGKYSCKVREVWNLYFQNRVFNPHFAINL